MGVAKVTLNGTTLMDTTGMTVTSNTMVSATTALNKAGEVVTGNIAIKSANDLTANGSTVTVPAGIYNTTATKNVASAAAFAPAVTLASSTGVVTGTNTFTAGYYSASTKTSTLNLTTQAAKTVTPTETAQTAVNSYRWTTGNITVAGISSNYVGTNVPRKSSADLTANLSTVTVPAGYYSSQVTKNVTSATAFAPAITLASATGVVTGTNTFTSAYYAATTKTSTLNLTTQAAQTFTPASTSQYISSYRWLTGSQTIKGDPNLVPSNIASGVSIFGVTGTHQGGGNASYTATIIQCNSTYNTSNNTITYQNTTYSQLGSDIVSFNFNAGEQLTFYGSAQSSGGSYYNTVWYNNTILSSAISYRSYTYNFTLPNDNIYIYIMGDGGFDIFNNPEIRWLQSPFRFGVTTEYACCWLYSNSIITHINNYKFINTPFLSSINLPNIRSIGGSAFRECYSLKNVSLPNVETIYSAAFSSCSALLSLDLPKCTTISPQAFYECRRLTSVNLPNCIAIYGSAFQGCSSLISISMPKVTTIASYAFKGCGFSTLELPNTLTSIQGSTFIICTKLKNITGGGLSTITSIDSYAFYGCSSLQSISFQNLASTGSYAFYGCWSLSQISLPNLTSAGADTFALCSGLSSVTLPLLSSVATDMFQGCNSLNTVNFANCTSIGGTAFANCIALVTVNIPNCTSIYAAGAFSSCTALTTISFSKCTNIGTSAFMNCYSLKSAYFSQCTKINASAFKNCYNLISLYLNGVSIVPTLSASVFYSTPIGGYSTSAGQYGSVFVPASLYNSFITATNWTAISSRIVSV